MFSTINILLPGEVKVYSFYWFDIKKNTREERKEQITPNSQNRSLQLGSHNGWCVAVLRLLHFSLTTASLNRTSVMNLATFSPEKPKTKTKAKLLMTRMVAIPEIQSLLPILQVAEYPPSLMGLQNKTKGG